MPDEEFNVIRTGAPAGVGCRHLAPPGAKVLGMLGSGNQARGQLFAMQRGLASLEQVRVFSPTAAHRERFASEMSIQLGIAVEPVDSAPQGGGGSIGHQRVHQ